MASAVFVRRRNLLIAAFLFGMGLCNLAFVFRLVPYLRNGYQDFTIYYMSGRILRDGRASALYNLAAQYQTQLEFAQVPIRHGPLPYNHPPFEALLFAPLAFLAYWPAYLIWTALNVIMLAESGILLRRFEKIRDLHPGLLVLGTLGFFPLMNGLLQGQDAILLLFLAVLALTCLDRGADPAAGAWLACGLFRPHISVPLVLLLAVRRWRVLLGFMPVVLVLAGISVAIVGWGGLATYVRFVLRVEQSSAVSFGPQVEPNLRGLIGELPGLGSGAVAFMLIMVASLAVFAVAGHRIRKGSDSVSYCFCLASVTAILVSYHALSHDLTLLLPLILFLLAAATSTEIGFMESQKHGATRLLLLFFLFLTPLHIFLVGGTRRFFWFGLILVWLFFRLLRIRPAGAQVAEA